MAGVAGRFDVFDVKHRKSHQTVGVGDPTSSQLHGTDAASCAAPAERCRCSAAVRSSDTAWMRRAAGRQGAVSKGRLCALVVAPETAPALPRQWLASQPPQTCVRDAWCVLSELAQCMLSKLRSHAAAACTPCGRTAQHAPGAVICGGSAVAAALRPWLLCQRACVVPPAAPPCRAPAAAAGRSRRAHRTPGSRSPAARCRARQRPATAPPTAAAAAEAVEARHPQERGSRRAQP